MAGLVAEMSTFPVPRPLPGPRPHCPICASDFELIEVEDRCESRIEWVCRCLPDTLRPHVGWRAPGSCLRHTLPAPDTSRWYDEDWAYYERCQRVRNLDRAVPRRRPSPLG